MRKLVIILTIFAVAQICGCANREVRTPATTAKSNAMELVTQIKNTDVHWDGTYLGLRPNLGGVSKELRTRLTADLIPALVDALKDKKRFVAAHVLLTEFSGVQFEADAGTWNGLQVELLPNGQAVIPDSQQASLVRQWNDWLAKH
jgi:hypothetical protein